MSKVYVATTPLLKGRVSWVCPGCKGEHNVTVSGTKNSMGATWGWNGSVDNPTFTPSVMVQYHHPTKNIAYQCHCFVRNGVIEFLGDCNHELRGQKVPMTEYPEGKPYWDNVA